MKNIFLLALFVGLFASCGNKKSGDMADHCKDPEFKKAHEIPDELKFTPSGTMVDYPTPDGKNAKLYSMTGKENHDRYLIVIHEWWGLNDHIKQEAERLHKELGVGVFALDMYDGNVATTRDSASHYMQSVRQKRAEAIVNGALALTDPEDKVATIGWCFGGGWSLNSAILARDKIAGCVIYYGMPTDDVKTLSGLKSDVLGIFATKDGWITPKVVESFEDNMKAAGKKTDNHWFEADHAFANPSSPRYQEEAAQKANQITLDYLKDRLE